MDISSYFSVWGKLEPATQQALSAAVMSRRAEVGTVLYRGEAECLGLVVLKSGRLRTYMISPDGREVTLYRLLEGDICLFSASCVLNGLQLDIIIEAERESELLIIPSYIFKQQMEKSLPLANYVNEIMNSRFSEVMWL
ncbi:MAG: Crp/Fnr family transcriptional regulator, partial [Firmicutes bacterium]|nr:Crp/Fnr family transcriptional regulator [Bacillota bacterium]